MNTASASSGGQDRGPVVVTEQGPLRGVELDGQHAFRGLPYAAAPVDGLRWQPPAPPSRWRGLRDATRYADHCAQPGSAFGVASTSEDCLFLNVQSPAQRGRHHRAPVIVWFHGGSLTNGESEGYDPTALVDDDVVVVTVNYRLGALGFLATPSLAAEQDGHAGNYGIMDQQAALRWVQRNIRAFGGDPDNVTVAGESAGGLSVLTHLVSPGSEGLFHRAIVQSGAYAKTQESQAEAEESGTELAAAAGCASGDVACLRALPVETILAHQTGGYVPHVDSLVLHEPITEALAAGRFHRVPVLGGSNSDEWRLIVAIVNVLADNPVTPENYSSQFGVPPAMAEQIVKEYPLSDFASPELAVGAVGTDATYSCTARSAHVQLSRYVPTYEYEFADRTAPQVFLPTVDGFEYGAAHASELPYLFGLPTAAHPADLTTTQQELATSMRQYWTSFARTGVPVADGTERWPALTAAAPSTQTFSEAGVETRTDFAERHHCDFWASLG